MTNVPDAYVQALHDDAWIEHALDNAFTVVESLLPPGVSEGILKKIIINVAQSIRTTIKERLFDLPYQLEGITKTYYLINSRKSLPLWTEVVALRKEMFEDAPDDPDTTSVGDVEDRSERIMLLMTEFLRRKKMDNEALTLVLNLATASETKADLLQNRIPAKVRIAVQSILSAQVGRGKEDAESSGRPARSRLTKAAFNGQILHAIDMDARDMTSIPRQGEERIEFEGHNGTEVIFRRITEKTEEK